MNRRLHLRTVVLQAFCLLLMYAPSCLAGEFKRAPLLSPEESLKAFQLSPELRIECVASEPQVIDPVDMAFDEDGRLYVAEMIDYPFAVTPGRGRIRLLEDTDGDGRMDKNTVFCEGLSWPTSVACWKGGVLVAAAPSIYYFKDTDGDGKADVKQELFTGFGRQNVQALVNNIKWSIENRFVCASGGNGGKIRSLLKVELPELSLSGRDFAFLPSGECEALTGGGQFGNTFDDFGRRFVCSNSNQSRHIVLEERYLKRNPFLLVPSAVANIASDGDAGPVFRTSPVEQWRILRTQQRLTGESPGLIEFGGKVAGYFTSATGITVYRGTALGAGYYGSLFIGDVASNLVHRKTLTPNGATFRADRVDVGSEFLTSTDTLFRPVNFANGPDGALYICDMCRECIEHPVSIPDSIKQHLDLNSKGRGRIWRVTSKTAAKRAGPHLSTASADQLVEALQRPDGWWRDTAQRLLFERQDKTVVSLLELGAYRKSLPPASRSAAMWVLKGMGSLTGHVLSAALTDPSPELREQALRVAESRELQTGKIRMELLATKAHEPRVQFQLALSLGEFDDPDLRERLVELSPSADSAWLQAAVLSSASKASVPILAKNITVNEPMARAVAFTIGARNDPNEIAAAVTATGMRSPIAMTGLAEGLWRKGVSLVEKYPQAAGIVHAAAADAINKAIDPRARIQMIGLLPYGDSKAALDALVPLISSDESTEIRGAAVRALTLIDDPAVGTQLLMTAIEQKQIAADDLSTDMRRRLRAQFKDRAPALIEEPTVDRKAVIARYKQSLTLKGNATNGQTVFQKTCATCHRVAGAGHELGPDIETVSHRTPEELLEHILDPSREVQAQYVLYTIATTDGRVLEGILTSQSAASVTLKRASSETSVILRSEIKTMLSSTRSPMPEELEKAIDFQQMADLIEFIRSRVKK